jgi:serine/threonine protein kinase
VNTAEDHLWDLLAQWEELYRKGKDISVEALCRNCPELARRLQARIDCLKQMDWLVKQDNASGQLDAKDKSDTRHFGTPADRLTWVGKTLSGGRYLVTNKLGEGGMGFVYRGHDQNLDTDIVIKVPRPAMLEDADFARRFQREIRSLVQLVHPHIVKINEVGEHDGLPFAVMQFLAGGTLRNRQRHGPDGKSLPMPLHQLTDWLGHVAAALDFIHQQHFIHRDVKPENILFDAHGNAYLSDFGVVKVVAESPPRKQQSIRTGKDVVFGTPHYMAPELILGQPYDGRVDQYALAVAVYELLLGRYPIDGPNSAAIFVRQTTTEPQPLSTLLPSVPQPVSGVIARALSKNPHKRFPNCRSFAHSLLQATRRQPADLFSGLSDQKQMASHKPPGNSEIPSLQEGPTTGHRSGRFTTRQWINQLLRLGADGNRNKSYGKPCLAKERPVARALQSKLLSWRWPVICTFSLLAIAWTLWAMTLHVQTKAGTLLLEIDQQGAEVILDSKSITVTTANAEHLRIRADEGRHVLKVTKAGFEGYTNELSLKSGTTEFVNCTFRDFLSNR